jgi:hypothetical protein
LIGIILILGYSDALGKNKNALLLMLIIMENIATSHHLIIQSNSSLIVLIAYSHFFTSYSLIAKIPHMSLFLYSSILSIPTQIYQSHQLIGQSKMYVHSPSHKYHFLIILMLYLFVDQLSHAHKN